MVDNTVLNVGTGGDTIASDDIAGVKYQRVKLSLGADGTAADAPVGGGVEAGSLRVTLASDSTGVLSVDDNSGSLTVDNGGTFAVQATLAAETTKVIGTVNLAAAQTLATVTTVSAVTAISNALPAGTNNIGDVDVLTVPADPFGANADAASATGSISAKLRFIAATGIPVTGTVTVGSHAVTNAGTFATQVDGAALTALQLIDNASIADDASFTPATTGVNMAGFFADETATDSVDEGDGGAARMTLDRKQIVTPYAHAAAGGHTPYKNLDVDESEDEVKASGGKLFWIHAINLAATKRYLKVYNNTAAGVTVGTTVPDLTFPIPTMADTNGAGFNLAFGDHGIALGTGITIAATTGFADNDTGAPGANEVIVNLGYL